MFRVQGFQDLDLKECTRAVWRISKESKGNPYIDNPPLVSEAHELPNCRGIVQKGNPSEWDAWGSRGNLESEKYAVIPHPG